MVHVEEKPVNISLDLVKVAFGNHLQELPEEKSKRALAALQQCETFSFVDVLTLVLLTIKEETNIDKEEGRISFQNLTHPNKDICFAVGHQDYFRYTPSITSHVPSRPPKTSSTRLGRLILFAAKNAWRP